MASENASSCARAQSLSSIGLTDTQRKALVVKAEALLRAGVLLRGDLLLYRHLLFASPGAYSGEWFHSHSSLAEVFHVCRQTIAAAFARLRDAGLILWERRKSAPVVCGDGVSRRLNSSNLYRIPAEALSLAVERLAVAVASRVKSFDCFRERRSKQSVARAALPAAPSLIDPSPRSPRLR